MDHDPLLVRMRATLFFLERANMLKTFLAVSTSFLLLTSFTLHAADQPTSVPTVTAADMPRVPATEAKNAIKTMKVRPGFHVELAASEPNVVDPIAMCFDERGRMFVIEMIDYSERREEKLSRVRMLEDTDNDGVYEKSTIYLDNLAWATALFWYDGGLLVGATPDIIYAKDTNNDGKADTREVLFTGFASTQEKLNVQGLFNNFNWGLDNRIHGCSGANGGMVKSLKHPDMPPIDVRGRGFLINPRDWSITTEAGGGQYGLSFDPWGQLYTCSNSVHIETFMYDDRYAANAPVALTPPRQCIAVDGPAAEVFRASPEEPWRVIRTRWRVGGIVKGMVEGGGRSAGYFTGATGITVYRGDAFGADYVGDTFTGDAGGNLVHHKRIRRGEDGITLLAERPADEKKIEFVASTDNWFRPVDFANAPDGTLYIADMYRETIEHPWSIPPELKQFLDLNSGNDRGRIWRIAPDGFKRPAPVTLADARVEDVVNALASPNGWTRDAAQHLIFERNDNSAVPLLAKLIENDDAPFGQLYAIASLDALDAIEPDHLIRAMHAKSPGVRRLAIKLSESIKMTPALDDALIALRNDPDATVRYQLLFTLGKSHGPASGDLMTALLASDIESPWMQTAYLASIGDNAASQHSSVSDAADGHAEKTVSEFLGQFAELIGAQHDGLQTAALLAELKDASDGQRAFATARHLAIGMSRSGSTFRDVRGSQELLRRAADVAVDPSAKTPLRVEATGLLAFEDPASAAATLELLLTHTPQPVQLAALLAFDQLESTNAAKLVLSHWPEYSPRMKTESVGMLINRPARAAELLKAVESGTVAANDVTAAQATALRGSHDSTVSALAAKVLPDHSAERAKVIASLQSALALNGDAGKGHVIYQKLCISCHRAGNEGFAVGPDFVTVKNAGAEKLLLNILDPNREVAPQYVGFQVDTTDGRTLLGVIASDNPSSLTLREAYGKETNLPRTQIKSMTSSGRSIMPEGLETGLQPQDVADLLQFISSQ